MSEVAKPVYKTFSERYHQQPGYKEKFLAKVYEKVVCDCGETFSRCNLSKHKKTKIHTTRLNDEIRKRDDKYSELEKRLKELESKLDNKNAPQR